MEKGQTSSVPNEVFCPSRLVSQKRETSSHTSSQRVEGGDSFAGEPAADDWQRKFESRRNQILVLRPTFQPRTNRSDRTGPRPQTSRLPTAKHVFSCGWGRRGRARTVGPFMLLAFPLEYESRCGRENILPPSKGQNQQPQPGVVQRCSRSFRPSGAVTADCSGQNNFSAIPPSPQSPTSISQQTTAAVARAAATVNGSVK